MAGNRKDEVPIESIPEVQQFVAVQQRFEAWKQQNAPFFEYLRQMASEYNEALKAAETACRQRQVTCGPIEKYSVATKYDWDALYDLYGRDAFLELGGALETIQKRSGDKKRVDFAIQTGKIDPERAKLVKKETGNFHKPSPIEVP